MVDVTIQKKFKFPLLKSILLVVSFVAGGYSSSVLPNDWKLVLLENSKSAPTTMTKREETVKEFYKYVNANDGNAAWGLYSCNKKNKKLENGEFESYSTFSNWVNRTHMEILSIKSAKTNTVITNHRINGEKQKQACFTLIQDGERWAIEDYNDGKECQNF